MGIATAFRPTLKRQSLPAPIAVNRTQSCVRTSSGVRGTPRRRRYAGLAHTTRRRSPTRCATSDESPSAPIRTPTSMPSSTTFTVRSSSSRSTLVAGYFARKALTTGATYRRPNSTGAVTASRPCGSARRAASDASASRTAARIARHRSRYSAPSSVRWIRRVVRLRSRTRSSCSSAASVRTTAGSDEPSASAARVRLPCSTIRTNVVIACSLSTRLLDYSE